MNADKPLVDRLRQQVKHLEDCQKYGDQVSDVTIELLDEAANKIEELEKRADNP